MFRPPPSSIGSMSTGFGEAPTMPSNPRGQDPQSPILKPAILREMQTGQNAGLAMPVSPNRQWRSPVEPQRVALVAKSRSPSPIFNRGAALSTLQPQTRSPVLYHHVVNRNSRSPSPVLRQFSGGRALVPVNTFAQPTSTRADVRFQSISPQPTHGVVQSAVWPNSSGPPLQQVQQVVMTAPQGLLGQGSGLGRAQGSWGFAPQAAPAYVQQANSAEPKLASGQLQSPRLSTGPFAFQAPPQEVQVHDPRISGPAQQQQYALQASPQKVQVPSPRFSAQAQPQQFASQPQPQNMPFRFTSI